MKQFMWKLSCIFIVVLSLGWESAALSHAIVKKSRPAPGEIVQTQPFSISLEFNARLDLRRSRLILIHENGHSDILAIRQDSEPHLLRAIVNNEMQGNYRLRWEVLAQDGHVTRGDIPFELK